MKQLKSHVRHEDPEIMSISHIHVLLLSSAISLIVSLTLPSSSLTSQPRLNEQNANRYVVLETFQCEPSLNNKGSEKINDGDKNNQLTEGALKTVLFNKYLFIV